MTSEEFASKYNTSKSDLIHAINLSIKEFISKHSEKVSIWTDEGYMYIQLSNIGIRDEYFKFISYIANYTTNETLFSLFNLPCTCVYASETVLRFRGKTSEMVETIVSRTKDNEGDVVNNEYIEIGPNEKISFNFDFERVANAKIVNRILNSNRFNKAVEKEEEKKASNSSKIKVYIISGPETKQEDGRDATWVEWTVTGILELEAGTTWNELANDPRLQDDRYILNSEGGNRFGPFNIAFIDDYTTDIVNNIYQDDGTFVGKMPEFRLPASTKVGDKIDTRDYECDKIWNSWGYQTDAFDYQLFNDKENYVNRNANHEKLFNESMVFDGTVITI